MKKHKLSGSMYDESGVNAVHDQVMNAYYAGTNETPKAQNMEKQDNQQVELDGEQLS